MTPDGEIRIRVVAPATEGKANREMLRFLAKRLDVSATRLRVVGGATSRHKTVEVEGLSRDEAVRRLAPGDNLVD